MPPKNPNAAKTKQKPQEEQREKCLQAVVSACFVQPEESYSQHVGRSSLILLRPDSHPLHLNAQE